LQRTVNLIDPFPSLYRTVLARLDRKNARAATCVLTNSAYSRESLYRIYGIFAHVGYLGVDTALFRPLSLPKENFIVSVGMINPQKGFDFLIRGLALLEKDRRPTLVIICNNADERERAYLAALAQQLQVAVEIRALIPDEELVRLYNQARLTVYAPVMEPFGFVPLESMACQTPVVGVREGGVRESVTDGVTGLLVEREPEALAATLGTLLDRADEIDRLGKNGRACVETQWTWDKSVENIEHYLQQATQGRIT
jgi:glycosyltransferase involved in cell wall biosynthesis